MPDFHEPVMVREVLDALAPKPGSAVVDGTLGTGGHAREIARRIAPGGVLIGMDRDPRMLAIGRARLQDEFAGEPVRLEFFEGPYEQVGEALKQAGRLHAEGMLIDMGTNSLQLASAEHGMSFSLDGPLDGRFSREEGGPTVGDIVNGADEREIVRILREFGEERLAPQIARRIAQARRTAPIATTRELAEIVAAAYPPAERHGGRIHPATRAFQAFRIAANDELGAVARGIRAGLGCLAPGGVFVAISFHSLEDRIAKNIFREAAEPRPDPSNPYAATTMAGVEFEYAAKGAVACSDEEAARNPRSRSAKLRAVRRREVSA